MGAAFAALLHLSNANAAKTAESLQSYFGEYSACALILDRDRHHERLIEFTPDRCRLPLSPCSTFKIPNALIGLQTGVINGPEQLKTWDGVKRSRKALNRDHTLQSAMQHSVVWYFQSLAPDVGEQRMQNWLERLNYGNGDISGGIDRFWLGSSLEIDAYGQLDLLKKLQHGALPFDDQVQEQVRLMLRQDTPLEGQLYGKTGSCLGNQTQGKPDHGWFIGWVDWQATNPRNPATTWFVINITGEEAWGRKAREFALELLEDLQSQSLTD
jgi:beta-lactamase class D